MEAACFTSMLVPVYIPHSITDQKMVIFIKVVPRFFFYYVLLTVHLSIFILVINQLDAQNLFYNKFIFLPVHGGADRQEVKIVLYSLVLYSLWYHHTYRCDDTRVCIIQF